MPSIYANFHIPPLKGKIMHCLPSVRWVPHDIPASDSTSNKKQKQKKQDRHRRFSLKASRGEGSSAFPAHRRKSTLSLTSIPDQELDARTNPQGDAIFFARLPIEIRKIVYEFVMGEQTIHLTLGAKRRFGHFICEEHGEDVECGCRVLVGGRNSQRLGVECLSLLRVCRRMYTEAVPHLYVPHTFSLLHITHLLYLPNRIPTPRLDHIRILRLRWAIRALPYLRRPLNRNYAYPEDTANWSHAWQIMANMKGLRDLYVALVDPSPQSLWERSWTELQDRLLEDVRGVKQCRWFEVMLPYRSCDVGMDMEDCNVRLRKPESDATDDEEEGD